MRKRRGEVSRLRKATLRYAFPRVATPQRAPPTHTDSKLAHIPHEYLECGREDRRARNRVRDAPAAPVPGGPSPFSASLEVKIASMDPAHELLFRYQFLLNRAAEYRLAAAQQATLHGGFGDWGGIAQAMLSDEAVRPSASPVILDAFLTCDPACARLLASDGLFADGYRLTDNSPNRPSAR